MVVKSLCGVKEETLEIKVTQNERGDWEEIIIINQASGERKR